MNEQTKQAVTSHCKRLTITTATGKNNFTSIAEH